MDEIRRARVDRFILEQIESVPQLEALLLLFNRRPQPCSTDEMAHLLYVQPGVAARILEALRSRQLAVMDASAPDGVCYPPPDEKRDSLIADVEALYRRELVRISSMIHSKASTGVLDFARAFRIKRDNA